jgi:hypothetical protein
MDKLGLSVYTLSNKTPDMRDVIRREQLLDEIHHGDGRVAVRGDVLDEQVDHLAPDIDALPLLAISASCDVL